MEKIAPEKPAMRVFLVEDNPEHVFVALTVITQVLGESTEIVVAENAEEAISLVPQFTEFDRPDLILVDLRLPNNGGFAVLSAIQEHQATAEVPTMVVTSSLFDRDIAKSYELGASAVLCKPLSRGKLREELFRLGTLSGNHPVLTGPRVIQRAI